MNRSPASEAAWALHRVRTVLSLWSSGVLTTRQMVRIAMRVVRFERWGVRPITQRRFRALNDLQSAYRQAVAEKLAATELAARLTVEQQAAAGMALRNDALAASLEQAVAEQQAAVEVATRTAARNNSLSGTLAQAMLTIEHLRRVEASYAEASERAEATAAQNQTARRGVQAWVNEWQRMLFEVTGDTGPSTAATTLVLGDQPVADSLATLINLSETSHGARPFQYAMPILAAQRPYPLAWRPDLPALRIVDVGSEELDSETDMYAPLRAVAPVEIIGFDPFAPAPERDAGGAWASVNVTRRDGSRVKTLPLLLGDGGNVTFHINRFGPTSSILPSNHQLTRQFGLLDLAVETIETRTLPSHRLDDVLPLEGDEPRIDLLKIDVQGAAHTLLENAPNLLRNTLVCHIEIEFVPVYLGEKLFGEIDILLRAAGFCFVDFFSLGRQRYAKFDTSTARAFHRGRTLWGDCIYIRGLDTDGALSADDLYRAACIVHSCYNKQDLAAELLGRLDSMAGTELLKDYIGSAA